MKKEDLKQRRERIGLKQTDFAEVLGVTSTTISRYETGLVEIPKWMELVMESLERRQIETLTKQGAG